MLHVTTFLKACLIMVWAVLLGAGQSLAAESARVDTGKVFAQLVSDHDDVAPGQEFYVSLQTTMDPKWHTYWLNPGDSGEPVQISWNLPPELTAGDIIWPLPDSIPTGPLTNYGFENTVEFPVLFSVDENAVQGEVLNVSADVFYLVCEEVCIPENATLELTLIVGAPVVDGPWDDVTKAALRSAPKQGQATGGAFAEDGQALIRLIDLPEGDYSNSYFFPESGGMVEHAAPQVATRTDKGLQLQTKAGFEWSGESVPDLNRGVLAFDKDGIRTGIWVDLDFENVPDVGAQIADAAAAGPSAGAPDSMNAPSSPEPTRSVMGWALLAFMGGLILNIMPCVFPVISLKALSVAKAAHGELKTIRREAWAYTFGILASFILLAVVVLALKAAGSSVGWAFHFQDPRVVAFLALLFFAIGLNLLGFFEISGSFQNLGQDLTRKSGVTGSFFTGVLAVIVATPCMAPFMGGSVGFALSQSPMSAITIFVALGLGFALPFLLIAYIPALSRALPKPGNWMVTFKELLAFPMFATVVWLVWILSGQSGGDGVWKILAALILLGFAIWLFRKNGGFPKALGGASILAGLALAFTIYAQPIEFTTTDLSTADGAPVYGAPWSADNVAKLRSEGQSVFVDFTANWCVSCKANEIRVLKQDDIKQAFSDNNTAFLIADWTNRNDDIANELEKFGRAGVPLYLLYPPGNNDVNPVILPQWLEKNDVKKALQGDYK